MLEGLSLGLTTAFSIQNLIMVVAGCLLGTYVSCIRVRKAFRCNLRDLGSVLFGYCKRPIRAAGIDHDNFNFPKSLLVV